MAHQLLLPALHHHHRHAADEVRRLLPHLRALVVQSELDRSADLREVGLGAAAEGGDDGAEAVEHDVGVVRRLLLEGVEDAVDEQLLQARVDVRRALVLHALLNRLHHHAPVRLPLVLQVLHDARHDVRHPHLVCDLDGGLHHLAVVAAVEGHAAHPERLEEGGHHLRAHVLRLHPVRAHALLDHLEDDLLHLLVVRLELADEAALHHLAGVVAGVHGVHERDDVPDRLEERRQHLPAVLADALPQRLEHRVERFNAVGGRRLGQRRQRQRTNCPHLLVLVDEPVLHDLHEGAEVREHGAAHEDGDLLDDLDARVARLPGLLGLAHRLEEGQQRGDPQRGGHHGERARRGVAHVLVDVVNVRPHRRDHRRQARRLGEVGDDLAALHAGVVVLVNEQGLDHHQDLVHEGPHQVVQLVQDAVDHLHQQMALLVLQRGRHEQRQDLVEERPRPKLARLVRQLPQRALALGGGAVLHLQQHLHDLALLLLLRAQLLLLRLLQQGREVLVVLGLHLREALDGGAGGDVELLPAVLLRELVQGRGHGRGGGQQLAGGGADGDVRGGGLQDIVPLAREQRVQLLVRHRPVALLNLALPPLGVVLLRGHGDVHAGGDLRGGGRLHPQRAHGGHAGGEAGGGPAREVGGHAHAGGGAAHRRGGLVPPRPVALRRRRRHVIWCCIPPTGSRLPGSHSAGRESTRGYPTPTWCCVAVGKPTRGRSLVPAVPPRRCCVTKVAPWSWCGIPATGFWCCLGHIPLGHLCLFCRFSSDRSATLVPSISPFLSRGGLCSSYRSWRNRNRCRAKLGACRLCIQRREARFLLLFLLNVSHRLLLFPSKLLLAHDIRIGAHARVGSFVTHGHRIVTRRRNQAIQATLAVIVFSVNDASRLHKSHIRVGGTFGPRDVLHDAFGGRVRRQFLGNHLLALIVVALLLLGHCDRVLIATKLILCIEIGIELARTPQGDELLLLLPVGLHGRDLRIQVRHLARDRLSSRKRPSGRGRDTRASTNPKPPDLFC
mmetsp:Transcript_8558/g.17750  ORF Transcript_8558/g.17750 Transcript_8558/m.17750 type:complete len:1008 (+) Transcript_8558:1222-4245(+)